ncbi:MAG: DNA topology modulation protein FlaR [Thermoleophilaceae bacterium]|nr:DNA topology modulation protein FlaR [Thermoleophilaceae bacterium]
MRRVAVIGCGGAGKSSLARDVGRALDLPVVHLDERYWQPGWRRLDPAAWWALQKRLVRSDTWVIDGNYLSTLELRLSAADTVVFLDLPSWRCVWRATWRVLRGRGRASTAPACPEQLDRRHLRFLRYIWRFPQTMRPRVLERLAEHEESTTILRLTTPSQVRRFQAELSR